MEIERKEATDAALMNESEGLRKSLGSLIAAAKVGLPQGRKVVALRHDCTTQYASLIRSPQGTS